MLLGRWRGLGRISGAFSAFTILKSALSIDIILMIRSVLQKFAEEMNKAPGPRAAVQEAEDGMDIDSTASTPAI